MWPFLPLGPLLARCRAVVHAGGLGTTAAVLTAGLPSAIVPAVTDQIWHARRVAALGVGVEVHHGALDRALPKLLNDHRLREGARALGERLRAENGPSVACDHIDAVLAGGSDGRSSAS